MDWNVGAAAIGGFVALGAYGALEVDAAGVCRTAVDVARQIYRARRKAGAARRPKTRRAALSEASEMVDVIRLGLSAGLSFDAALGLYCAQRTGELADRMARARMSWQMGMVTREEGLAAAARDMGVRQLESFAAAVGQAHALGAPLADTLARQGREMRDAHRAAVEREIERAPVKMLIPTGTLILPALLLSIVGPLLAAGGML